MDAEHYAALSAGDAIPNDELEHRRDNTHKYMGAGGHVLSEDGRSRGLESESLHHERFHPAAIKRPCSRAFTTLALSAGWSAEIETISNFSARC